MRKKLEKYEVKSLSKHTRRRAKKTSDGVDPRTDGVRLEVMNQKNCEIVMISERKFGVGGKEEHKGCARRL